MSQPTRLIACPSTEAQGQAALCPLGAQHPACEAQNQRPLSQVRNRGLKAQPNSGIPSQIDQGVNLGLESSLTLRRLLVWTYDPKIRLKTLAALVDHCQGHFALFQSRF